MPTNPLFYREPRPLGPPTFQWGEAAMETSVPGQLLARQRLLELGISESERRRIFQTPNITEKERQLLALASVLQIDSHISRQGLMFLANNPYTPDAQDFLSRLIREYNLHLTPYTAVQAIFLAEPPGSFEVNFTRVKPTISDRRDPQLRHNQEAQMCQHWLTGAQLFERLVSYIISKSDSISLYEESPGSLYKTLCRVAFGSDTPEFLLENYSATHRRHVRFAAHRFVDDLRKLVPSMEVLSVQAQQSSPPEAGLIYMPAEMVEGILEIKFPPTISTVPFRVLPFAVAIYLPSDLFSQLSGERPGDAWAFMYPQEHEWFELTGKLVVIDDGLAPNHKEAALSHELGHVIYRNYVSPIPRQHVDTLPQRIFDILDPTRQSISKADLRAMESEVVTLFREFKQHCLDRALQEIVNFASIGEDNLTLDVLDCGEWREIPYCGASEFSHLPKGARQVLEMALPIAARNHRDLLKKVVYLQWLCQEAYREVASKPLELSPSVLDGLLFLGRPDRMERLCHLVGISKQAVKAKFDESNVALSQAFARDVDAFVSGAKSLRELYLSSSLGGVSAYFPRQSLDAVLKILENTVDEDMVNTALFALEQICVCHRDTLEQSEIDRIGATIKHILNATLRLKVNIRPSVKAVVKALCMP